MLPPEEEGVPGAAHEPPARPERPHANCSDTYQCPSKCFCAAAVDGHGVDGPPAVWSEYNTSMRVGVTERQPAIVSVALPEY